MSRSVIATVTGAALAVASFRGFSASASSVAFAFGAPKVLGSQRSPGQFVSEVVPSTTSSANSSHASGWALSPSVLGLLSLCAAAAARALTSTVTRFGKRRTPPRPTDWNDDQLGYRIKGQPGWPGSPHAWTEPIRWAQRFKRRIHIRRKVEGNCVRPRMAVFRSTHHMHVNIIDDTIGTGITLLTVTSKQKENVTQIRADSGAEKGDEHTWSIEAAELVGREIAKKCLEKNITMVVFDRGGFPYEGRVKALAEAARSGGLQF
mmetsp:Transcript_47504/g.76997  ORF Transcript_47504/g.76997 Transcript_47504/m.76997 type:complete len:263 (+) Transcript_47504:135-923(+)